jgi:predicted lipoprotein with Yx(FWY)xxD motif
MQFLKTTAVAVGALVATAAFAVAASGSGSSGTLVKVGPSSLGRVLVDTHGKTLYIWAHDKGSRSTCNGECAEYWPPLLTRGRPAAGAGARAALLGTSRRSDGRIQATYAGHPLYYFVQDTKPGQTKGEALTGFGGRWDPVSASGTAVRKRSTYSASWYGASPLKASVISPRRGDSAGVGGTFSVDLSLEARTAQANSLLPGTRPPSTTRASRPSTQARTRQPPASSCSSRPRRRSPAPRSMARTRTWRASSR